MLDLTENIVSNFLRKGLKPNCTYSFKSVKSSRQHCDGVLERIWT